jgi:hypothetical protein
MSLFLKPLLFTILIPSVTSGILYLILRNIAAKVAVPIAVTIGYLAAYVAVVPGLPNFPPKEFKDYVFYLAVFGLVWGGLETLWRKNLYSRWGLRALMFFGILLLVLRNRLRAWQTWEIILWFVGIIVVLLVAWWVLERLTEKTEPGTWILPPTALFIALLILITGTSVTTVTSGSASLGQLGGALAASVGAIMVLSWLLKIEVTPYLAATVIFLLGTLWLGGAVFAKVPVLSAIILALSPLPLLFVQTPNTMRGTVTRLAISAIPIVLVMAYALWRFAIEYNQPSF